MIKTLKNLKNLKVNNPSYNSIMSKSFFKEMKKNKSFYIMMIPGLFVLFLFSYIPMVGVLIAFKNYSPSKGIIGSEWVGFKNFEFFFKSIDAFSVTINTISYNLVFLIIGLAISLMFAILIEQLSNKYLASFYKSVILIPYLFSWVVVAYILFAFLSPDKGFINYVLGLFGKEWISWYGDPIYWRFIIPISYIWKNVGYAMIILIAGITGISKDYYEAAEIDGANKFQQTVKITIPMIMPIVITLVLISAGKIFYANFGDWGMFYTLPKQSGILLPATDVIDTYIYRSLKDMGDFGISSAVGFYQSCVGCVLVLVSNYVVKKFDSESSIF